MFQKSVKVLIGIVLKVIRRKGKETHFIREDGIRDGNFMNLSSKGVNRRWGSSYKYGSYHNDYDKTL